MIHFEDIHPDIVPVLRAQGIEEKDLFKHHSDLYVGCKDWQQAQAIRTGGKWNALSSTFRPQKGSEMDQYPAAVDIAFGAMALDFQEKHGKTN